VSDCAVLNLIESMKKHGNINVFMADVNEVRDIHEKYQINSVPSFLSFEKNEFRNVAKGCNQPGFYNTIFENIYFTANTEGEKPQARVTVYSTPTCSWCNTLKSYLRKNNIRFREIDVSKDEDAAKEMVRRSGQQGVPQTDINGQLIIGFDKTKINNLLGIQG